MPSSIVKILALAALACSSASAAAIELDKRGGVWTTSSTCPSGNGETYTGPSGNSFLVACDSDTSYTGYNSIFQATSFINCMQHCGSTTGCGRVVYIEDVNSPGACYLKAGGSQLVASAGHKVATLQN
ncbi:hypothetical protein LTR12_006873 [Friedmanniomyces endolithicus]|nr:hypothetical protein LTR74_012342 [Friedmanniomyces endolithicus]KAK1818688.1 hypothetical protein LTR12_006873 [Friedmanniomyces endolithicus]